MVPTSKLLEQFIAALAAPAEAGVTHFAFMPDPSSGSQFGNINVTVQALDASDTVVTSYSAAVILDSVPPITTIMPLGWSNGEMVIQYEADDADTYTISCTDPDDSGITGTGTLIVS